MIFWDGGRIPKGDMLKLRFDKWICVRSLGFMTPPLEIFPVQTYCFIINQCENMVVILSSVEYDIKIEPNIRIESCNFQYDVQSLKENMS